MGGILGLSALYVLVQPVASSRVGGLFGEISVLISNGIKRISDPSVGGLRDYRKISIISNNPQSSVSKIPPIKGPR